MELQAPQKRDQQTYRVPIETEKPVRMIYRLRETGSHSTPPDTCEALVAFRQELFQLYQPFSRRWFSKELHGPGFFRSLTHAWDVGSHAPFSLPLPPEDTPLFVEQQWRPVWLTILPGSVRVQWILEKVLYGTDPAPVAPATPIAPPPSGLAPRSRAPSRGEDDSNEIATQETNEILVVRSSLRERAKQKVRAARLRAALSDLRARQLLARYYERYGVAETIDDGGSVLSSSEEEA